MIEITLDVKETFATFEVQILNELAKKLTEVFRSAKSGIISRIRDMCDGLIQGTPEYASLMSGELLGELGVPGVKNRMERVLEQIKESVTINVQPVMRSGRTLVGGMTIGMIETGLRDILSLTDAEYATEKGRIIPWLEWLTTAGDEIIIWGYRVKVADTPAAKARSRTGLALMVEGQSWRVSPEFSGTVSANFLQRAFDVEGVEKEIARIMAEEIQMRV